MIDSVGTSTSVSIEAFLDFIRSAVSTNSIAEMVETEANDLTQDILHSLELEDHKYHEKANLASELIRARKERRVAKDNRDITDPIVEWAENNRDVIKSIERVLGETRKRERKTENRIYVPRVRRGVTDV